MDGQTYPVENSSTGHVGELLEVTLITSADHLTKTFQLGNGGELDSIHAPALRKGTADRLSISVAEFTTEFSDLLEALSSNQAIVLGRMTDAVVGAEAELTTKERHRIEGATDGNPIIWRGKQYLEYQEHALTCPGSRYHGL